MAWIDLDIPEGGGGGFPDMCKFRIVNTTGNVTARACDYVLADATSADLTITAPSSLLVNGLFAVRKTDASVHAVTLRRPDSTLLVQLVTQDEAIVYRWDGADFVIVAHQAPSLRGGNLDPYLSPEAWYVFTPADGLVDQSGHGHTLSGSLGSPIMGPQLGMCASYNIGLQEAAPKAVWRTNAAVSVVSLVNINSSAGDRWFASCEIGGGFNTWWKFGVGNDGRACYGVNNGVGSVFYQWGTALPTTGWHTFGWVRETNGLNVHVYLDGDLWASGAVAMFPAGGGSAVLSIGKDFFQPVQPYRQQMTGLWVQQLNADQMRALSDRIQGTG